MAANVFFFKRYTCKIHKTDACLVPRISATLYGEWDECLDNSTHPDIERSQSVQ